jgi:hypothetical protein
MLEQLSPEFDFDARRSPLADPIAQKLKEPAEHRTANNSTDRQNERGKRISQKNPGDDKARESQPPQPCKYGAKSHKRRSQDTDSDTPGPPEQTFIEIHICPCVVTPIKYS